MQNDGREIRREMGLSSPSELIVRSTFPYLFPRISWFSISRIYINFSLFSRTSTARSTLSALRLSKLSRRDETRLSCGAQILPFSFFFPFFCLVSPVVLDKSCQKDAPLAVICGQFYNLLTFVCPSLVLFPALMVRCLPISGPLQHSHFPSRNW